METTGTTTGGDRGDSGGDAGHPERSGAEGRPVRVSYVEQGFGVALQVGDESADGVEPGGDVEAGLLRVSDAVVTLEIPHPDGGRSFLSWDPAEVSFDPLVA